jgi:hypothetical protein
LVVSSYEVVKKLEKLRIEPPVEIDFNGGFLKELLLKIAQVVDNRMCL